MAIARQREDCLKLCQDKGWTPVEYVDNDTSASSGKTRRGYSRMLADIRNDQRGIGAVVCWDLDRLHRRPVELEDFMAMADERRLALATVSGDVDLSTAQGRLVARLKGAVARHEVEHKSARQRSAARQKAKTGKPQWTYAFGYIAGTHEPDPTVAPLIREAYRLILAGASLGDVMRLWNEAGALTAQWSRKRNDDGDVELDSTGKPVMICTRRPWIHTQVSNFLRKPRNAALRSHTDCATGVTEIVGKGTWPPLVDEATWRAAQAVLGAPGRAPGRKSVRRHQWSGMLKCGRCEHTMGGQWTTQKTSTGSARIAYGCKHCHGVSIRAEQVDQILMGTIVGRLIKPDAVDLLRAERHDDALSEQLREQAAGLYRRLDGFAEELADGLLTARQLKVATERVQANIDAIEAQLADQERLRVFDGIRLGTPEAAEDIATLSPDRLRTVLGVLAEVTIAPVGKGGHTFKPERVQVAWR